MWTILVIYLIGMFCALLIWGSLDKILARFFDEDMKRKSQRSCKARASEKGGGRGVEP